jgi:hypothetical protein
VHTSAYSAVGKSLSSAAAVPGFTNSAALHCVVLCCAVFCRVYKGRWHGMDVAVKIMDPCSPDKLPRVLKEAEVMMGLSHQNVVQAYQCSVWSKKQQEQLARVSG